MCVSTISSLVDHDYDLRSLSPVYIHFKRACRPVTFTGETCAVTIVLICFNYNIEVDRGLVNFSKNR